jgi:uncharacterized OB-fold protein
MTNAVLPDVTDALTAPFWAGTARGVLRVQRCTDCTHLRWPPAPLCPACQSFDADWVEVDPAGTLISYCVYHRAFDKAFADLVPYAVGYVQLTAGPRLHGLLTGPLDGLAVDAPVAGVFETVSDDVTFVRWHVTRTGTGRN